MRGFYGEGSARHGVGSGRAKQGSRLTVVNDRGVAPLSSPPKFLSHHRNQCVHILLTTHDKNETNRLAVSVRLLFHILDSNYDKRMNDNCKMSDIFSEEVFFI